MGKIYYIGTLSPIYFRYRKNIRDTYLYVEPFTFTPGNKNKTFVHFQSGALCYGISPLKLDIKKGSKRTNVIHANCAEKHLHIISYGDGGSGDKIKRNALAANQTTHIFPLGECRNNLERLGQ